MKADVDVTFVLTQALFRYFKVKAIGYGTME